MAGGAAVKVGTGSSASIRPNGDGIAFNRSGKIWYARLSGSGAPAQLIGVRGGLGSFRWSPDGSKLAFVSARADHSFIGVYDMAARAVDFLAPSTDADSDPVWSTDGTHIAFIRQPASTALTLFAPVRSAQPWSIMVGDVATRQARQIWRADDGHGSALRSVVADNQLAWGAGDRIVFPWERDGWTHLYSVAVGGGQAVLLTPGEFEVEYVTMSRDGREVIFNSNQGDLDRRHLWRVSVSGGAAVQLTRGEGIEWYPVPTADGKAIALFESDARRPGRAAIVIGDSAPRELAPDAMPNDYPAAALVIPTPVVLSSTDGMRVHGQLFLPADLKPGEHRPALLFFHGGSRRQMLLGWHYMQYYHNAYAMNQYLAGRGLIVLSVNYRSGIGYGLDFREALDYGATGASEFNDVMGAGLYLRSRGDVDPARIGLWGGSYGGFLTAMGLARASDLFAAGVDFHGVHDWNTGIRTFVPSYNRLEKPDASRLAFEASPLAYVDGWRSPVLLIHGDDDRNVSFSETIALIEKLRARKVDVEQLVFPDEVHDFLRTTSWSRAYTAAEEFFERKLVKREP